MRKFDIATGFHIVLLALTILVLGLVYGLPLLSTVGFESANLFVIILGPLLFLTASTNRLGLTGFSTILLREAVWLAVHLSVLLALLLANGFFRASCSEGAGVLPFLIISIPPLLLAISLGCVNACLFKRAWLRIVVVMAAIIGYAIFIGISWWQEPAFRILSHASLIMSTDLMAGGALTSGIVGYRFATLLLASSIIWLGLIFFPASPGRFKRRSFPSVSSMATLIALLSAFALVHVKSLEIMGKDRAALEKDYQLFAEENGVRIFANPLKTSHAEALRILQEARYYQLLLTKRLGTISSKPIIIWLHQTGDERFLYTGAKNVHFALPAHREIHLSGVETPHDVLGHELAHIYVGEHTASFFGVPVSYAIIPHLALTEGLATALSHELNIENGMTLIDQARALYQANVRIDVAQLFSSNPLYFASAHPRASYIYSGATIIFVLNQFEEGARPELLRKVIEHGNICAAFKSSEDCARTLSLFMLELGQEAPAKSVYWAGLRFAKTSILSADCSEKSRSDNRRLTEAITNHDASGIQSILDQLPLIQRTASLTKTGESLLSSSDFENARVLLARAQSESTDATIRAYQGLALLYAHINLDSLSEAEAVLQTLTDDFFFDSNRRLIALTKLLLDGYKNDKIHRALCKACLKFLYAQTQELPVRLSLLAKEIGHIVPAENTQELFPTIARYIEARFYLRSKAYIEAQAPLAFVLNNLKLLPELVQRETHFMQANLQKGLQQNVAARYLFEDLLMKTNSDGEKIVVTDEIQRLRFLEKGAL